MPNDAISREAAIEAVKDISDRLLGPAAWAGKVAAEEIAAALASLPADTRWQELRKYILAIRNGDVPVTHTGGDYVTATCNLILGEFHRLAPAPAEDKDAPKRPPMLLATRTNGLVNTELWMTRRDADWSSQWHGSDDCDYKSRDLLAVNRDHSDPEALRLYLEDMAEAQD